MPQPPDAAYAPNVVVDDSKKYIVQLEEIEERDSKYRDRRKDAMTDIYKFLMFDQETGEAIIDDSTGEMFMLWRWTDDLTYDNPTTGKIAAGREIANALIGHRLSDDEVTQMLDQGWEKSLKGKRAVADVEWYRQNDGSQRLRLLRLKPYVKKEKEKASTTSKRRLLEDDD